MHFAILYCYLEFKLRYFKNLKMFSVRVKELFKPIVKKRRRMLALFLLAFSEETDFKVTLGDFEQNSEGKCLKIDLVETKFAVRRTITIM